MLRDQAVARVKVGLGFRTDSALDSTIVTALQEAQRDEEMGKELPWFLEVWDHPLTVLADGTSVTLPTDFIREIESQSATWTNEDGDTQKLLPISSDGWRDRASWGSLTYSDSYRYVLRGGELLLWPAPTAEFTIYLNYYAKADTLESNIENAWLGHAPDILIGKAGLELAAINANANAANFFSGIFSRARDSLSRETIAKRVERIGPVVIGSGV